MYIKNNTLDTAWHKSLSGLQKFFLQFWMQSWLWLPREQLIPYIFLIWRTWLVVVWMYAYYVSNLLPSCCEEPTVIAWTDEACLSLPWIVYKADRLFLFLNRHFVAMLSSINELKMCISNWYNFGITRSSVFILNNVLSFMYM